MKNIINNKKIHMCLILIACCISLLFILKKGIVLGHDLEYHLSRISGLAKCLKNGDIRGLIHPGFYDYGYANGLFYSNIFIYIPAILNMLGLDIINCYKVFIIITTIITAFSMYYCTNKITKSSRIATISSIIYTLSIYRIVDVMVRAAVGETLAFVFIPIIILGLYELIYGNYKRWYIFSIGFVGLVNCHLISTVMMAIITVILLLCSLTRFIEEPKRIKYLIISAIVGLCLGAFFIIPMLEQYVRADLLINTQENEIALIAPLNKVFVGLIHYKTRFFPGGIGLIFIILPIMWLKLIITKKVDVNDKLNKFISLIVSTGLVVLLCSTDILPWNELSKILGSIQFTWRLYLFTTAFISIASGYIIEKFFEKNKYKTLYISIIVIYCSLLAIINQVLGFASLKVYYKCDEVTFLTEYNDFSIASGEYVPATTDWSLIYNDKRIPQTNNDDIKIEYKENKGKYYIEFSDNIKEDTYIDIPLINYLGYSAKSSINNRYYKISDGYNTWIRINIGNINKDKIVVWYRGTKITRISYIISILSWIIFILSFIITKKNYKKKAEKIREKIIKNKYLNNAYTKSIVMTLFIIIAIFIVRRLYPFGNETVSNADMAQAFLPAYYNLWDFFHGTNGILFNFNIGSGANIYDFGSIYGFYNPVNWLILLSARDNIVNFINYILIAKLLVISITSTFLFKNLFKNVSSNIIALYSCLYALSGYTISYYTNFPWLDVVGLFPFIILSLYNIFNGKDIKLYTITLALSLIFSFYISYMILLFILFSTGIYLLINRKNKELDIETIILKIGLGTVLAIGLSAFALFPVLRQTLDSSRFGIAKTLLNKTDLNINISKLVMLCFYGLPFVYFLKYIKNYKNNKKEVLFFIIMLFMTTITIVAEKINLMWHTGSYLKFPYRFAFIPIMLIYLAGLSYLNNNKVEKKINKKNSVLIRVFIVVFSVILLGTCYLYIKQPLVNYTPASLLPSLKTNIILLVEFIISIILISLILKLANKKIKKIFILLIVLVQVICNSKFYLGISRNYLYNEYNDISAFNANEIYEFGLKDKTVYKYKDINNTMQENYPFISNKSALSTWHMIQNNQKETHAYLGYATYGTKLKDRGGTLFSDQLLGINRIISNNKINDNTYNYLGKTNSYYIYEYSNKLPYGIIYDKENYIGELDYSKDKIDIYNTIYKKIYNQKDNIFKKPKITITKNDNYDEYIIYMDEKSYLYFEADINNYIEVIVNGKIIKQPFINSQEITRYDNTSGMINLGEFEDEFVNIRINKAKDTIYTPKFIQMNLNIYNDFVNNYKQEKIDIKFLNNEMQIKLNSEKNKSLFIPITYSKGLSAKINGETTKINKTLGNYLSINLEEGENDITISFFPPLLKMSIIITIISILLLIILERYILKKYELKKLKNILKYVFIIVSITMFIYIYIYPYIR